MPFDIQITKQLGDRMVQCDCVTQARLTALFGPSGAGKTSILNMVAGLMPPDSGVIRICGETLFDAAKGINIAPQHRHAGYVFQDGRLFPHLKVRANLHYGIGNAASGQGWISEADTIDFLGIGHLLDRWPRHLSGGEKQRVAIGRALLSGPRFLLMDEPLSSLDQARREDILRVIERIRDDLRLPMLYVSHDRGEVERLADQLIDIA